MNMRPRHTHIFAREADEHYVEPSWCSERLFQVEQFRGSIVDPACGWGTIVLSALKAGYVAAGSDLVQRGWDSSLTPCDFLESDRVFDNIVTNPPYQLMAAFVTHAVLHSRYKAAIIFPVARLPAAQDWLEPLPLARVYLLRPRPSMPPGKYISAGNKPAGGRVDYCWLVFERGYSDPPELKWLVRGEAG